MPGGHVMTPGLPRANLHPGGGAFDRPVSIFVYGAYGLVRGVLAACKAITGDYSGLSIMSLNRYLAWCVSVCDDYVRQAGPHSRGTVRVSHVTASNFCTGRSGLFASNVARAVGFCRTMEHETGREHARTWLTRRGWRSGGAEV